MADGGVIECPPTPELVTQCPATPPPDPNVRIREFLKNQLLADNSSDDNSAGDRDGAGSPPPNCAICLGKISSKCFTNSCMHQFCFSCLLEWSKVKPECPLCKQTFKSIIHNVTSMDTYEEYKVEHRRCSNWTSIASQFEQILYASSMPRYQIPRSEVHIPHLQQNSRFYALFLNNSPQTERFAILHNDDIVPSRSSGCNWRFYVYQHSLYALPLLDVTGRTRDISAQFYRNNPAQIYRLLPWINREILMIVRQRQHVHQAMGVIEEYLITFDITSRAFRTRVKTYLHRYTAHFIHELTNFARSQYDMIGYDRYVQYRPVFDDLIDVGGDTDDDTDDDPVLVSDMDRTDDSVIVFNNSHYGNPDWMQQPAPSRSFENYDYCNVHGSNSGSSSSATSTQSAGSTFVSRLLHVVTNGIATPAAPAASVSSGVAAAAAATATASATSSSNNSAPTTSNQPTTELVNIESDDSDECMYVGEQKPPHLRTPVMVELNSDDSDSDVVFVNEDKAPPLIKQECSNGAGGGAPSPSSAAVAACTEPCTSAMADLMAALEPHMTMYSSSSEDLLSLPQAPPITVNRRKQKLVRRCSSLLPTSSSEDLCIPLSHLKRKIERLSPVAMSGAAASVDNRPKPLDSTATASFNFTVAIATDATAPGPSTTAPTLHPAGDVASVITKNFARPVRKLSHRKKPHASIYQAPSSSSRSSSSSISSSSSSILTGNNSGSEYPIAERRLSTSSSDSFLLHDIPTQSDENSLSSSESSHEEFSVTELKRRGTSGPRTNLPLKKRRVVKRSAPPPATAPQKSTNIIPPIASLAVAKAKAAKSKRTTSSKSKRQSQSATRTIDRRQRRHRKSRQTLSNKLKNVAAGDVAVDGPQSSMMSKRRKLLVSSSSSSSSSEYEVTRNYGSMHGVDNEHSEGKSSSDV